MQRVLVPLDGSARADGIVPPLAHLLGGRLDEVVLLRVLSPRDPPDAREGVRQHLAVVRGELEGLGARVTTVVRTGDPAREILAAMNEHAPDVVALSSHGRGGLSRLIRGSVAERVLRRATAPVLLVTPRALDQRVERRVDRILVPLDGTERSAAVLPVVEELARAHGAEVVLARIAWEGLQRPLLAATLATDKLAASLRPYEARLRHDGIAVRTVGAHGDFAREIVDLSESLHTDLIAMATHGRRGVARFLDGSVSERVLHRCDTPLLLVRAAE